MAKQNETGHAKNAANFRVIIAACQTFGAAYNPPRTELTVAELIILADKADKAIDDVQKAVQADKDATNAREIPFKEISKLSTRIFNGLAAFGCPKNVLDDARSLINKLGGRRTTRTSTSASATSGNTVSVSQMSYDMRADSFKKLVTLVENQASYNPNEVEMKTTALKAFSDNLIALNKDAVNKRVTSEKTRIVRDIILYTDANSVFNIAADIKKYAIYLYGAKGPQYKQISGVKITNTPKKL